MQRILKTNRVMNEQTISSFQGFGHRVQLVRRSNIARRWAVVDNRKVLLTTHEEEIGKNAFLNEVASIVRQLDLFREGVL